MYNANGYRLLERKPPFGHRFTLSAFLACGERASRSVIPSQIVLSLHLEDAHNPVFGSECLLCKRSVYKTVSMYRQRVAAGTYRSSLGLGLPWEASGFARGPAPVRVQRAPQSLN